MLQQDEPEDYVIATGETRSLKDFVEAVFSTLGMNWEEHVEICKALFRPTDILVGKANPEKAARELGWRAKYKMRDVARMMVAEESRPERS